jgi:hypothetical protein
MTKTRVKRSVTAVPDIVKMAVTNELHESVEQDVQQNHAPSNSIRSLPTFDDDRFGTC